MSQKQKRFCCSSKTSDNSPLKTTDGCLCGPTVHPSMFSSYEKIFPSSLRELAWIPGIALHIIFFYGFKSPPTKSAFQNFSHVSSPSQWPSPKRQLVCFGPSHQHNVSHHHCSASCFSQAAEAQQPALPSPSGKWKYQPCLALCAVGNGLEPAQQPPLSLLGWPELGEAGWAVRRRDSNTYTLRPNCLLVNSNDTARPSSELM